MGRGAWRSKTFPLSGTRGCTHLLKDEVCVSAPDALDGRQGKHDVALPVDVGVEHTQDVLKVGRNHQGHPEGDNSTRLRKMRLLFGGTTEEKGRRYSCSRKRRQLAIRFARRTLNCKRDNAIIVSVYIFLAIIFKYSGVIITVLYAL